MQVLLDAHWLKRSVQRSIDSLDALIVGDPKAPVPTPKILAFAWGSRVIKPIVLTSIAVVETAFLNGGDVARATLDLEFVEIPPSDADPTDRARLLEAERAKIIKLTERQKDEATKFADDWIKANLASIPATVQESVKSGDYELTADDGGIVKMTKQSNKTPLGIVGIYKSKKFEPTGQKFN